MGGGWEGAIRSQSLRAADQRWNGRKEDWKEGVDDGGTTQHEGYVWEYRCDVRCEQREGGRLYPGGGGCYMRVCTQQQPVPAAWRVEGGGCYFGRGWGEAEEESEKKENKRI